MPEALFQISEADLLDHGRVSDKRDGSQHVLEVVQGLRLQLQALPD